ELSSSNTSMVISIPNCLAMAGIWRTALDEPPTAKTYLIILYKFSLVSILDNLRSSLTMSTILSPDLLASLNLDEARAPMVPQPGKDKPTASTAVPMVLAVPIIPQAPQVWQVLSSINLNSSSDMKPALN